MPPRLKARARHDEPPILWRDGNPLPTQCAASSAQAAISPIIKLVDHLPSCVGYMCKMNGKHSRPLLATASFKSASGMLHGRENVLTFSIHLVAVHHRQHGAIRRIQNTSQPSGPSVSVKIARISIVAYRAIISSAARFLSTFISTSCQLLLPLPPLLSSVLRRSFSGMPAPVCLQQHLQVLATPCQTSFARMQGLVGYTFMYPCIQHPCRRIHYNVLSKCSSTLTLAPTPTYLHPDILIQVSMARYPYPRISLPLSLYTRPCICVSVYPWISIHV